MQVNLLSQSQVLLVQYILRPKNKHKIYLETGSLKNVNNMSK